MPNESLIRERSHLHAAAELARDADIKALNQRLTSSLRGEVYFDAGTRALYATDASNYRQVPIGVVVPRDADDVIATVAACLWLSPYR